MTNAKNQAQAQFDSIKSLVDALSLDWDRLAELRELNSSNYDAISNAELVELLELEEVAQNFTGPDDVERAIDEDPLSVEVRSGWTTPGQELKAEEFCILLCTGGPAVRIVGELDHYGEPVRAWIEYQDWGTPWTQLYGADQSVIVSYSSRFFFGG